MNDRSSRGPTPQNVRLLGPDLIRGLGILLLLVTNVPLILTPIRYEQAIGGNLLLGTAPDMLATGLFLAIPPMTGMGMFILAMGQGLSQAGEDPHRYHIALRRLAVIGAVGLAHGLLVWWGDILFYYLIAGLVVLYFRGRPPLAQIAVGISVMLLPLIITIADLLARFGVSDVPANDVVRLTGEGYKALQSQAERAYSSQSLVAIQEQRFVDWLSYFQDFALVGLPQLVGLLLVGIGIARIRSYDTVLLQTRSIGVALCVAFMVAGIGYVFQFLVQIIVPEDSGIISAISSSCQVFSPPVLAIALYIAVLRSEPRLTKSKVARFLAFLGRYSLTIYLGTSLLCVLGAYGLAFYSHVSMSGAMAIAVILFAVLSGLCALLDRSGKQGPFEALVRAVVRFLGGKPQRQLLNKGERP